MCNNEVKYFDILDPNLVHYTAYLRITLEKLFSLPVCLKMKNSFTLNSIYFLFYALTFHLMHMYNFLGFIITQVVLKIFNFFLPYILRSLRLLPVYTDASINNRGANELVR